MTARSSKNLGLTGVLAALAMFATACGGATVDNTVTETSIAPLTRSVAPSSDSSESASDAAADPSERSTASRNAAEPAAPLPQDQPAEEISELPQSGQQLSGVDRQYLDDLKAQGINVDGVEDQMIGTASIVCRSEGAPLDGATVEAIAGQLIEQGRTTKEIQELVSLIDSSARKAYC